MTLCQIQFSGKSDKFIVSCLIIVEGNLKALFSIATTLRCKGRCYSIPWIAPLTLDPYLIMLSVKQGGIKNHFFESLV